MPLSLTLRIIKGSALTIEELDGNFEEIAAWVAAFEASPTPPNGIADIVQDGTQLTIYLDDSTALGPFTLPSATAIVPVVTKSDASLTLASEDRSTYMRCTNVAGCTITIETEDEDDIPIHSEFHFRQCTAGPLTFEAATDVIINGIDGFDLATDRIGAVVTLKKVDENEFDAFGLFAEESTASA